MAKRGRPDTFDRIMRDTSDNPEANTAINSAMKALLSNPDLTQRQQQNRYYADIMSLFVLDEISDSIPYLDEIEKHPTIMEQLGRMLLQDGYEGPEVIEVIWMVADWYHNKDSTAKELVKWLKDTRRTGKINTFCYTKDGKKIYNEKDLKRTGLFSKDSGISETASEI